MKHIKSNHNDHLGSSTYLTDKNGGITTRYEYLPYGELMRESSYQNLSSEITTRYRFSGKEYDEETGYYYFGARYYDPRTSQWLSVDPLAGKYPNMSPYNYCAGNPVKYIDPDGNCFVLAGDGNYIPCPEGQQGQKQKDAFGYNWTYNKGTWELSGGSNPSKVNFKYDYIEPTGSPDYYIERYKNHIEKYNTRPPDYYLEYGNKYINRFKNETRPKMSSAGKDWLDQTAVQLQVQMNNGIKADPSIQGDNDRFTSFAFGTHVPAYTANGTIKKLPMSDLWKIYNTPDFKEKLGNFSGIEQSYKMALYLFIPDLGPRNKWAPLGGF